MRKILITNDDGIDSPGIIRLAKTALEFGQVWVVAPAHERSAASHCITFRDPIEVREHEFAIKDPAVKAFACSGTPADSVRVGGLAVMPEKPDVVLSGINYGYNVATDIQYSATAGAAFEAAFQGFGAIALSEEAVDCHEVTDAYLKPLLEEYIDKRFGRERMLNINFPGCRLNECKGILKDQKTSGGTFYHDRYNLIEDRKDGTKVYMVKGIYNEEREEGTDFKAVVEKYISVSVVRNIS